MSRIKEISDILSGKASVKETFRHLEVISKADLRHALADRKVNEEFKEYLKHNHFHAPPIPLFSEKEIDEMWDSVQKEVHRSRTFRSIVQKGVGWFLEWGEKDYGIPFKRISVAVLLLVLLLYSPMMKHNLAPFSPGDQDIKGEETTRKASLQYAIVAHGEKLVRPDRPLTEEDTIAFRINLSQKGYVSVYVLHDGTSDKIISDGYFPKGEHDLDAGYQLKGNRGKNVLALTFSSSALNMEETAKQKLIVESVRNGVSSLTIGDTFITLTYETIEIR